MGDGEEKRTPDMPEKATKMAKKEAKLSFHLLFERSGRDSNPRAVARKLISSQPRYDHFDTAACMLMRQFSGFVQCGLKSMRYTNARTLRKNYYIFKDSSRRKTLIFQRFSADETAWGRNDFESAPF